jgi:uncharacterized protein (UPF0297 family)
MDHRGAESEVPALNPSDANHNAMDETVQFRVTGDRQEMSAREILLKVYDALVEKEYHPINQIVGYLLSGDPAYIPRHNNARSLIRKKERDELIEELVRFYLERQR